MMKPAQQLQLEFNSDDATSDDTLTVHLVRDLDHPWVTFETVEDEVTNIIHIGLHDIKTLVKELNKIIEFHEAR